MRVLVVEDDPMIAEGVVVGLKAAGMSVDWVRDGVEAQAALRDGDYAVALLDLGLPGADGFGVLKFARAQGIQTPVLVITARDGVDDRALDGVPSEVRPLVASMNGFIVRLCTVETQKRFLADAANELRTPVAAMQIRVDILAAGHDRPEASMAPLAASVKRASALVNQLLRLARLDEPAPAAPEAVDVGALLLEGAADYAPLAEQKGVDLGLELGAAAVSETVEADVRTLFAVLIDNAVRYTPSGGSVDVKLFEHGKRTIVEIVDTGPGLPRGQESRIFDRFFRGAPADSEGTGLGLAIARRVAARNGFELTVENRADGVAGVRARIVFPDKVRLIRS